MNASWILSAAIVTGHLVIVSPEAVGQGVQPRDAVGDRMGRLQQHRSILENALQPPRQAVPAQPPAPPAHAQPPARALQAPEPVPSTQAPEPVPSTQAPEPVPSTQAPEPVPSAQAQGQVSCEAAAQIVANYGFSDVRATACSGDFYRFSATRDGTAYSIGITAADGEIADVSRE